MKIHVFLTLKLHQQASGFLNELTAFTPVFLLSELQKTKNSVLLLPVLVSGLKRSTLKGQLGKSLGSTQIAALPKVNHHLLNHSLHFLHCLNFLMFHLTLV